VLIHRITQMMLHWSSMCFWMNSTLPKVNHFSHAHASPSLLWRIETGRRLQARGGGGGGGQYESLVSLRPFSQYPLLTRVQSCFGYPFCSDAIHSCGETPRVVAWFCEALELSSVLPGLLPPQHGASSGCGWRIRPPDMENSCEFTE